MRRRSTARRPCSCETRSCKHASSLARESGHLRLRAAVESRLTVEERHGRAGSPGRRHQGTPHYTPGGVFRCPTAPQAESRSEARAGEYRWGSEHSTTAHSSSADGCSLPSGLFRQQPIIADCARARSQELKEEISHCELKISVAALLKNSKVEAEAAEGATDELAWTAWLEELKVSGRSQPASRLCRGCEPLAPATCLRGLQSGLRAEGSAGAAGE